MHLRSTPRVSVYRSDRAVATALARRVVDAVSLYPRLVLGLPTGRTPIAFYDELAAMADQQHVDFSGVTTFNLDEFVGVPASHPGSYRTFMETYLFCRVNIDRSRVNFLDGTAADSSVECLRYERAIEAAGGIDLLVVGIGTNGHVGFNEPGDVLEARTHRVTLRPETRRSNAALFGGDVEQVPAEALSMGMATILQARSIVLLATGASKASCIDRAINGPLTTALPGSFLQLHRDVDVMLDDAAAGKLRAGQARVLP